jgi:hypothetical protein
VTLCAAGSADLVMHRGDGVDGALIYQFLSAAFEAFPDLKEILKRASGVIDYYNRTAAVLPGLDLKRDIGCDINNPPLTVAEWDRRLPGLDTITEAIASIKAETEESDEADEGEEKEDDDEGEGEGEGEDGEDSEDDKNGKNGEDNNDEEEEENGNGEEENGNEEEENGNEEEENGNEEEENGNEEEENGNEDGSASDESSAYQPSQGEEDDSSEQASDPGDFKEEEDLTGLGAGELDLSPVETTKVVSQEQFDEDFDGGEGGHASKKRKMGGNDDAVGDEDMALAIKAFWKKHSVQN